jgi:hypothetical protein
MANGLVAIRLAFACLSSLKRPSSSSPELPNQPCDSNFIFYRSRESTLQLKALIWTDWLGEPNAMHLLFATATTKAASAALFVNVSARISFKSNKDLMHLLS